MSTTEHKIRNIPKSNSEKECQPEITHEVEASSSNISSSNSEDDINKKLATGSLFDSSDLDGINVCEDNEPEVTGEKKVKGRCRKRKSSEDLDPSLKRERARLRAQIRRIMKSDVELEEERQRNRIRQRQYRLNKSEEELARIREKNRLRQRQYRRQMSQYQLALTRENNRLRQQERRRVRIDESDELMGPMNTRSKGYDEVDDDEETFMIPALYASAVLNYQ